LFWFFIYGVSHWFILQTLSMEPIGEMVVRHLLSMMVFFLFVILIFSNLVAAFSSFFLSDDLQLLMTAPLSKNAFFAARFVENSLTASWMTLVFGSAPFIAIGVLMNAQVAYYGFVGLVFLSFFIVPSAIAIILALLLCSIFSARRARHVMVFLGGFTLVALLLLFRGLAPEELLRTEMRGTLIETLANLEGPSSPWMLTTWAQDVLWSHLGATGILQYEHSITLLILACGASFFMATWVFRNLHPYAFSRAQEGLAAGMVHNVDELHKKEGFVEARRTHTFKEGRFSLFEVMWRKDARTFVRDTAQWSQMLLVVALISMYVLNFSFIEKVVQGGIISGMTLHFLNLILSGFVIVAMSARFVYPLISLEGKAFWLIRSSPNSMDTFLRNKWKTAFVPLILVANSLTVLTNWVLGSSLVMTLCASVSASLTVVGVVGIAVGLGARFPKFHVDNAAKIAAGFGGVLYMMTGTGFILLMAACAAQPTLTLYRIEAGYGSFSGLIPVWFCLSIILSCTLPFVVGRFVTGIGAKYLNQCGS
jgi:ABC-2 type transport system permease protein